MAGANSNIQLTSLDFNEIKNNLKVFLKSQDTFKDYNFEGSGLSVLLDVMAYNTQYNAYYLNQVANEMFLDSATQRNSVVSHAKLLNYIPKSVTAPTATVRITFNGVKTPQVTIPAYTNFYSTAIDGVNYNFVTTDSYTETVSANTVVFNDVELKQGTVGSYTYTVDSETNPTYTFEIPDGDVDTSTIIVGVQESNTNTSIDYYTLGTNILSLNNNSLVYFLQESMNGTYEIYFGDGILGKKLVDGNIVKIGYLSSEGSAAAGANRFSLLDNLGDYTSASVTTLIPATYGTNKETIDSIKFQAPKNYAAQGRAVTKEDYITAIQQNKIGVTFDAVNVWGGEENYDPVYGQVFICLKPEGSYLLTETQKQRLIDDVIKPISVMTVVPNIVDPDYTYININSNVLFDSKKTLLTSKQIMNKVKTAINNYSTNYLNTFNSTFSSSVLSQEIQSCDKSIISNDFTIKVGKKFYPSLTTPQTYVLYYNTPLERGSVFSGVTSFPALTFRDPVTPSLEISGVYIEEIPGESSGVDHIHILNPGYSYQKAPIVTISGDGTGAKAVAKINSKGSVIAINITDPGENYTSATVTITPATGDKRGRSAKAVVTLIGQYGTLRTYFFNSKSVKTVLDSNAGTIDYVNGIITLNDFNPLDVDDPLGQLGIYAKPKTTIISSTYNGIISIDPYDTSSSIVNVISQ